MELKPEVLAPVENNLELNENLSAVITYGLTELQGSFEELYKGPKNSLYQQYYDGILALEDAFLSPEDDEYVIREQYPDDTEDTYRINLAPQKKINIFYNNNRGNHNLDLLDGPVNECQLSISRFTKTSDKTDDSFSNSGYKVDIMIKKYALDINKVPKITTQPAGLGLIVRNDGSTSFALKNFILKDFPCVIPPYHNEGSKYSEGARKYLSTLKIPRHQNTNTTPTSK